MKNWRQLQSHHSLARLELKTGVGSDIAPRCPRAPWRGASDWQQPTTARFVPPAGRGRRPRSARSLPPSAWLNFGYQVIALTGDKFTFLERLAPVSRNRRVSEEIIERLACQPTYFICNPWIGATSAEGFVAASSRARTRKISSRVRRGLVSEENHLRRNPLIGSGHRPHGEARAGSEANNNNQSQVDSPGEKGREL